MASEWIQSDGGPLLLIPSELLHDWGGDTASDDRRACEVVDEIAPLDLGAGMGLVLGEEPHMTSWA